MFDYDKRFIDETDAMQFYMQESTKAFARFNKAMEAKDVTITLRSGNILYGMPECVTESICNNSQSGRNSKLKGHFKRDIVRNISQAVIFDLYAEQLETTGKISIQVAFDAKGKPLGDAENITTSIVDEMQTFDNAFGEDGQVEVDSTKIEFCPNGKESFVATEQSVKRMDYMSKPSMQAPVQ